MGFKKTVEIDGEEKEIELSGVKNSNEDALTMPPREMHGRKPIYTNVDEITADNVLQVLNEALNVHRRNRADAQYLEKYLRGIQPILDREKIYHTEINNRVVVNVANQIVTFKTSEFAGEPIQYVSRGNRKSVPKKVDKLNSMMLSEGKKSKDMELAYKMFTTGVGYRLVLNDKAEAAVRGDFDEAPFEIYIPDPLNTFVIKRNDVTRRVLAGVNYVFTKPDGNEVLFTVYTANQTFTIRGTLMNATGIEKVVTHNFGMVNMVEYPCNSVYMGAFEVVLPLLDAYNTTMSNRLDAVEQFVQALMVFEGVDIDRADFLEMKDLGAIKLPPSIDGKQSKVYYLNEQLDQSQTQTLVDDIYSTILQIVGMPSQGNANTSDSSNNGAIIMKNGWWNAEARALETAGMWTEAETQFLKIVLKICEEANVLSGLKVSDVEPKFSRRSYEDLLTKTQSFSTLRSSGCPSIQAFKFSHLSQDPESDAMDFDAYQEEKEAALNAATMMNPTADETGGDVAPDDGEEVETGKDDEGTIGVCPVCGKRFRKRTGNQVYDRADCRRQAWKRFGGNV